MKAKTFYLDGQDIQHGWDYGISITMQDWKNGLQVSDASSEKSGKHWREVTETRAVNRMVVLAGWLDRVDNENEQEAVEFLESIFALQSNVSILKPRKLKVVDIYDREWELNVKIKEPVIIEEWDESFVGSHWNWRVVLESVDDPAYEAAADSTIESGEGVYGWWSIPMEGFTYPISFDDYIHLVTITPGGNSDVYPVFTFNLTGDVNAPLVISNVTKRTKFSLDVSGVAGDVIVVDSKNMICTKNDVNINALRIINSVWPVISGETSFFFWDLDTAYTEGDFEVTVTYRKLLR